MQCLKIYPSLEGSNRKGDIFIPESRYQRYNSPVELRTVYLPTQGT
jgi:hypothetical protein